MKKLLLVCFMLLFMAGSLMAYHWHGARLAGLGFPTPYTKDFHDVFGNPASIYEWKDMAYADMVDVSGGNQFGGVNIELIDNLVFGIAVNRKYGEIFDIAGTMSLPTPVNGIDFVAGYNVGTMKVGLGIYKVGAKQSDELTDSDDDLISSSESNSGMFGINLGTCMDMGETNIEARFNLRMNSYKTETENSSGDTETYENKGGMGIGFGARAFVPMTSKLKAVPAVWLNMFKIADKYTNSANSSLDYETGDWSSTEIGLGIGGNYEVDHTTVIMSASFIYETEKDETVDGVTGTETCIHLPALNLGVEHNFWKGLTGRIGLRKTMGTQTMKSEIEDGNTTESKSSFSETANLVSLGLGAKIGNFNIDWHMVTPILFNNFYIVSGSSSGFSSNVTASYGWK